MGNPAIPTDSQKNLASAGGTSIQGIYEAFAIGEVPAVLASMDPRIEWNEAEHFPCADGNP